MSLSKRSKVFLVLLLVAVVGAGVAYSIIYKPHPTTENQEAAFTGTAEAFKSAVAADQNKWQNAIVKISGTLSEVNENGSVMEESIFCQFTDTKVSASLSTNSKVTVKGRFIGYDDLLEEIKLDNCIIVR